MATKLYELHLVRLPTTCAVLMQTHVDVNRPIVAPLELDTCLHRAVAAGDLEMCRVLVEAGACGSHWRCQSHSLCDSLDAMDRLGWAGRCGTSRRALPGGPCILAHTLCWSQYALLGRLIASTGGRAGKWEWPSGSLLVSCCEGASMFGAAGSLSFTR